jgi:ADP-heptose:LPS heptosyltransferase
MFKKILIVGHSNIGDVCYDLAVVHPLQQSFPEAKISFLTSPQCKGIVEGYRGIDKIITFDRHGKDKGVRRLRFVAGLRKEKFNLAVVLKSSLTYTFLGIPHVWKIQKKERSQGKHLVELYLKLLRDHGLRVDEAIFDFALSEQDRVYCEDFFKKKGISPQDTLVGILPLAAWSLKSWPIEKWNQLAVILKKQYEMKVINLGKLPNNDLGTRISKKMSDEIISADKTSLAQAKALLQCCKLFIGPDSSFLHLASCMGIETIALFGATSHQYFYPYFHRHNIILPRKNLPCMPCYPGPGPSCNDDNKLDFGPCMEGVSVEDVVAMIKERLFTPEFLLK